MERNQYFMYGILVPYKEYLELDIYQSIDDVLVGNDGIQGIFTNRDSEFMIIGELLLVEEFKAENNKPHPVPLLEEVDMQIVRNKVFEQYGLKGEFHYYFVTKVR